MGHLKSKPPRTGFSRDSISAGKVNRVWRNVKVKDLKQGDIVANKGLVHLILQTCGEEYYFQAGEEEYFLLPDEEVFAFVEKGD